MRLSQEENHGPNELLVPASLLHSLSAHAMPLCLSYLCALLPISLLPQHPLSLILPDHTNILTGQDSAMLSAGALLFSFAEGTPDPGHPQCLYWETYFTIMTYETTLHHYVPFRSTN